MADLIKKIKIKKQDGTFTDYIPIGAEAQNVSTNDGDSVELKLNKKPYYYNSVANMKADTKLKARDMAVTLGYYEINDGGGATYKITDEESQTDYQEELENGLYATLNKKDVVNVKELGAKGNGLDDDSQIISLALSKNNNIYLPTGTYLINQSITIKSNTTLYGDGEESILKAGDNLYHLIYITLSENVNVHDLCLTGNAKNREERNNLAEPIYGMSIDYSKNIIVENVTFTDMGYTQNPESGGNMLSLNINEEQENKQSTENCIVRNCKFIDKEARSSFGIRLYSGWDLSSERKYYVKNNKIENCYFTGLSYNAIEIGGTGCVYNIVNNNIFEDMKCIICLEADKGASYNHFTNNVVKNMNCEQNQNSYAFKDGSSGTNDTQSVGNIWIGNSAYNIKQNVSGGCGGMELVGAKETIVSNLVIDNIIPYDDTNTNSVGIYIGNSYNNNSENIQINNSKIKNVTKGNGIQILSANSKDILINNNEIYNCNYGVRTTTTSSLGNINVIGNNIHDCTNNGVNINQNTKIQVKNNYIENVAMGIFCNDGANGSIIGNVVHSSGYAIRLNGDNTSFYVADNNIYQNFYMPDSNLKNKVINNNVEGLTYEAKYVKKVKYQTSIPVSGSHLIGDVIYNTTPTAGGYIGWVCTSSGTPGTWKGFGLIES